jgi:hypothetical protein
MNPQWTCVVCGTVHEGLPLDWGFDQPWYWNPERDEAEGFLNSDLCFIKSSPEGGDRFVRGLIEIPILDGTTDEEEYFGLGVWVSLSERNFRWYVENFEAGAEDQGEPWFGWLSNKVPVYPDTLSLKTDVHLRGEGLRPAIVVQPTDHPLAVDQHGGITLTRARELAAEWMHTS